MTERLLRLALDLATAAGHGPPSEGLVTFMGMLGLVYLRQNDLKSAERLFRKAVATAPPQSRVRAHISGGLGRCLALQGDYENAEELLVRQHRSNVLWLGRADSNAIWSAQHLVDLYRAWGRPDDADRWHRRLLATKKSRKLATEKN